MSIVGTPMLSAVNTTLRTPPAHRARREVGKAGARTSLVCGGTKGLGQKGAWKTRDLSRLSFIMNLIVLLVLIIRPIVQSIIH